MSVTFIAIIAVVFILIVLLGMYITYNNREVALRK